MRQRERDARAGSECRRCSSEALEDLGLRVRRLSPDRRDPERFHIEKSELAAELRRLAAGMRGQRA